MSYDGNPKAPNEKLVFNFNPGATAYYGRFGYKYMNFANTTKA
jgi:hypothetical protein